MTPALVKVRKTRSDKGKKHRKPETKLQTSCVQWLVDNGYFVVGSPGGAAFRNGAHRSRVGQPGATDLVILEPGGSGAHGLCVELKANGPVTAVQKQWMESISKKGYNVGVVRSEKELKELVAQHVMCPVNEIDDDE